MRTCPVSGSKNWEKLFHSKFKDLDFPIKSAY